VGAFGIGRAFTYNSIKFTTALWILAGTNALGMCCTIFVPETARLPLEEASTVTESLFGKMLRKRGIEQVCPCVCGARSRGFRRGS
jgi:hypothetical protein